MDKLIIANWKSNPKSIKEARVIWNDILKISKNIKNKKIIICPPFPFIFLGNVIKNSKIILGAQSVFPEAEGSYTGEVFANMLKSMNVNYVIVGHSERRKLGETDEYINKQILTTIKNKITPILCIGEIRRDHDGRYLPFVKEQILKCLDGVSRLNLKNIMIAYEPVWAIGKNAVREATSEEFVEMKIYIKKVLSDVYGVKVAQSIPIIYGGSVNSKNAKIFIENGADGLLVGRDSLSPKKFREIINAF